MKDRSKWPYKGHMNPGDHDDFPNGCKGNCDGVCEGYGRDELTELLDSEEGGHLMAVGKIVRLQDERDRYKAMVAGLEARAKQAELERDGAHEQIKICLAGLDHYAPEDCDSSDEGLCARCKAIKLLGVER